MSRPKCPPEENIVRAITEAHYDGFRVASSLFKGSHKSVSRLAVLDLPDIVDIFLGELDTPKSRLMATGEINVGRLMDTANSYSEPVNLDVEIDPTPKNPAHAEIPQKISKGLSRKICAILRIKLV